MATEYEINMNRNDEKEAIEATTEKNADSQPKKANQPLGRK